VPNGTGQPNNIRAIAKTCENTWEMVQGLAVIAFTIMHRQLLQAKCPWGKSAVYVIGVTILGIWVSAPCEKFTLKLSGMNVFFSTVIRSMALTRYKNIFSFFLSVSQV